MGLYDIFDDISKKQVIKTDTGDNRIFGVMVGNVTENYDMAHPGMVCVEIPVRDKTANVLKWAKVAFLAAGKKWGSYWLPEIGDEVLVCFEQGNIEKPYVIGCVPKSESVLLKKSVDARNKLKELRFQNGMYLSVEEDLENEGNADTITLSTSQGKLFFTIQNENQEVLIKDKESENMIMMVGSDDRGLISIKAKKKLQIKIGEEISFTMNGDTGTVSLECKNFMIKTDSNFKVDSQSSIILNGQTTSVSAGNVFKVDSSGPVKIAGSPIKLG